MKFNHSAALSFLETLDQIHLVAISTTGKGATNSRYFDDAQSAVDWAAPINSNEWGIYWTASAVPVNFSAKPSKSNIRGARFAFVDIDPPKNGGAFDRASILGALDSHECPPSFVIDSGNGLQAFWRLCDEHRDLAEIEGINRQLRDYYDADPACWNIDRLMRLPGSINWPTPVKKARGRKPVIASLSIKDNGLAYWPREIASAFPAAKSETQGGGEIDIGLVNVPKVIARKTPSELGIQIGSSLYDLITQPIDGDRSGAGLRCVRLMAQEGYSDAEIAGILANGDLPISGHYIDQQNTQRAIARAIAVVRADIPEIQQSYFDLDAFVANAAKKRAAELAQEPSNIPDIAESGAEPNWLKGLSGPLREYVDYCSNHAPSPQPLIALGCALAVFGVIQGRRYESPTGYRPNMYVIGMAEPGSGKDYPMKAAVRLLQDANLYHLFGGADIASGTAIITSLVKQPSLIFTIDEIGMMLSALSNPTRAPKFLTDIVTNLTRMFTTSNSTWGGIAYANQDERPRDVVEHPNLCLLGMTTPASFWGSFTGANSVDGSLARMLILQSEENYPPPRKFKRSEIPASLVLAAQAMHDGAEGHNCFPLGEHSSQAPKPYTVPFADSEAEKKDDQILAIKYELLKKWEGNPINGVQNRIHELTTKCALIRAVSNNPKQPAITAADLEWGYLIAKLSIDNLVRAVKEKVADNEQESKLKRVHAEIAKAGSNGIAKTDLSRACKFMGGTRALNDVLDMLLQSDMIRIDEIGEIGRKRRIYYDTTD